MSLDHDSPHLSPGLYLVPTPIGNLKDLTFRALEILQTVDAVAAEDTRTTRVLFQHYHIKTPIVSYHEHNAQHAGARILKALKDGQRWALVSDAGTPLISDPGYRLVQACLNDSINVIPLPGASSVLTALIGSGLPTQAFTFAGFVPTKTSARKTFFQTYATTSHTLVVFETARRLPQTLETCFSVLGDRKAVIGRELTKFFETFHRGSLQQWVQDQPFNNVKGEIVLMIEGQEPRALPSSEKDLDLWFQQALETQSLPEAVRQAQEIWHVSRRELYARALVVQSERKQAETTD